MKQSVQELANKLIYLQERVADAIHSEGEFSNDRMYYNSLIQSTLKPLDSNICKEIIGMLESKMYEAELKMAKLNDEVGKEFEFTKAVSVMCACRSVIEDIDNVLALRNRQNEQERQ